jgi:hypothetical protein
VIVRVARGLNAAAYLVVLVVIVLLSPRWMA